MVCPPTKVSVHASVFNVWQCIRHESKKNPLVGDWIAGIAALSKFYIMVQTAIILSNSAVNDILVTVLLVC